MLEGNEEILNARSLNVVVSVIRHAVAVSDWDEQKSVIDLLQAGRSVLKNWAANKLRTDIISSLGAITADGNVQLTYAAASAAQRNTWLVNNADRVLVRDLQGQRGQRCICNCIGDSRQRRRQDDRRTDHPRKAAGQAPPCRKSAPSG